MEKNNVYKKGIIDTSSLNVLPEKHEYKTAKFFAEHGYDIKFIKPSNIHGLNNPDFLMAGKVWEMKCPIVYSKASFEDNFRKALKQSPNIIFDLRRLSKNDEIKYLNELGKRKITPHLRALVIITHDGKLLTEKGELSIIKT